MKELFQQHRNQLISNLENGDLALLFSGKAPKSTADAHYSFLPNKNFFYFTGCTQEHFVVAILKTEVGFESTLFIEKPDYEVEKWIGRKLTTDQAKEISGIEDIQYLENFTAWLNRSVYSGKIERLYLDLEKLNWDESDSPALVFSRDFTNRYPFVVIKTLHFMVSELRMIKSALEIDQIQKAVDIAHDGLNAILKILKNDVYEYQLEATFAHSIRMSGADGNSFPTIAASGKDAVILHYVENSKKVTDGDLVLLDLGAQYNQYASDISRTYPVSGKFTERQETIYNIVLKAHNAVIEAIKPDVAYESLNNICKKVLCTELKAIGLISDNAELTKYYYHGVSHHLGLDVHDLGNRNGLLKPGMVLTVEPGLYIAEESIGIRIEDDVLVTVDGNTVLSAAIPRSVKDIEQFMSKFKK